MPFTLSHAVAVLPLARSRRLVPAALVIGSWVPDLPYFVPLPVGSRWTHAASGPVSVDLVLGLLVLVLWRLVLRRPLADLAPRWLRERLRPPAALTPGLLLAAAVSVVLGALTHVVWDTFTHADRWGTTHVALLAEPLGPLPAFKWFQFASGLLGLAGLGLWLLLWVRRTPARPVPTATRTAARRTAWLVGVAVVLVTAALVGGLALAGGRSLEASAFAVATRSMGAGAAAVLAVCLLWSAGGGRLGRLGQVRGVAERPAQREHG